MRVLHIHERDLTPVAPGRVRPRTESGGDRVGGLGAYLCALLDGLGDAGVEVSTLAVGRATGAGDDAMRFAERAGFRFRFDRVKSDAIVGAVEDASPDLVHVHAAYYTLHPRTLGEIVSRWRTVATVHDVTTLCFRGDKCFKSQEACDRPLGLGCVTSGCYRPGARMGLAADLARVSAAPRVRGMYASLDRLIAPSGFIRDTLLTNGCRPDRVEVHPLFSRFESHAHAPCPYPTVRTREILFVGRLDHGKGAELFVESLQRLSAADWRAVIIGDGPLRSHIERAAQPLIESGKLLMAGSLDGDALAESYRCASVVVFPSIAQESFGLVGVEAMSLSRPVVALERGGVREWLEHNKTGLLASSASAEHLADCIDQLLNDPERASQMGEAGRSRVLNRFTQRAHIERLMATYSSVLASERAGGG